LQQTRKCLAVPRQQSCHITTINNQKAAQLFSRKKIIILEGSLRVKGMWKKFLKKIGAVVVLVVSSIVPDNANQHLSEPQIRPTSNSSKSTTTQKLKSFCKSLYLMVF